MKITMRFKGSATSGNHGHKGRPGFRGGSQPNKSGAISEEAMLAWHNAINIATYDKLHQRSMRAMETHLTNLVDNVVWSNMTREQFINRVNEPGPEVPKASRADKHSVAYMLYSLKNFAAENPGTSVVNWDEMKKATGMDEGEFDYFIYSKGGQQFFSWERTHGLNQLRLHAYDYAWSPKNGIISSQQAVRDGIKALGYSNPSKFYDYLLSLRP